MQSRTHSSKCLDAQHPRCKGTEQMIMSSYTSDMVMTVVYYLSFHVPQLAAVPFHSLPVPLYILCGCLTGLRSGLA